jgi:tricorn protease-like protein
MCTTRFLQLRPTVITAGHISAHCMVGTRVFFLYDHELGTNAGCMLSIHAISMPIHAHTNWQLSLSMQIQA